MANLSVNYSRNEESVSYFCIFTQFVKSATFTIEQGGHGTGKTRNLAVNFSRQEKHREFSKFNFLHRENCGNTGNILKI